MIQWVECPRDAMQGIENFIPTERKVAYLQALLNCNFDYLDFGSFVSPRAVPQMSDTRAVVEKLDLSRTQTRLLAIIANDRGAQDACGFDQISTLGFPFSLSEIFQMRNTNKSQEEAFAELQDIAKRCHEHQKELVVYLSMGFGNPYGTPWSLDQLRHWIDRIAPLGISCFSLSDTMGNSTPERIKEVFQWAQSMYPSYQFGAHLHTRTDQWRANVSAAYEGGCRRFDTAIQGFGGCPMASDHLVGNLATEKLLSYLTEQKEDFKVKIHAFEVAYNKAKELFDAFA